MKKYILLLITLFSLSACQDFLDETPKGILIPKTVNDFGILAIPISIILSAAGLSPVVSISSAT